MEKTKQGKKLIGVDYTKHCFVYKTNIIYNPEIVENQKKTCFTQDFITTLQYDQTFDLLQELRLIFSEATIRKMYQDGTKFITCKVNELNQP